MHTKSKLKLAVENGVDEEAKESVQEILKTPSLKLGAADAMLSNMKAALRE